MRRTPGACCEPSQRLERALILWLALGVGLLGPWAGPVRAQGGIALSIERCDGLPFDVEAYAHAVEVELVVLNAAALVPVPDSGSTTLSVRSPSCDGVLTITLRVGEREASESVRASDYAGIGQPRALALATIETLRVLTLRLQAQASSPEPNAASAEPSEATPAPAADPKASEASAPAAVDAAEREAAPAIEARARAGAGLFGAPDLHAQASAGLALWGPLVWLDGALAYGHSLDSTRLGEVRVSELVLAVVLELHAARVGPLELALGAGLRGGLAWASVDSEPELASGRRAQPALAPLLFAVLPVTLRVELGRRLLAGVILEPGYGVLAARFTGPTATDVGMSALAGEPPPRVARVGPSLDAGLMLGYRF